MRIPFMVTIRHLVGEFLGLLDGMSDDTVM